MNTWQPRCDLCGHGAGPSGLCPTHREQQRRQRLSWRMEDALDLLDDGEHPERVARRLSTTVAALEIQCRRSGNPRPELTRERDRICRRRARANTTESQGRR